MSHFEVNPNDVDRSNSIVNPHSTFEPKQSDAAPDGLRSFRTAVLRGLGVVAPPLLTLVILLWIVRSLDYYLLDPIVVGARNLIASSVADVQTSLPRAEPTAADPSVVIDDNKLYQRLASGEYIPLDVYRKVELHSSRPPINANQAYQQWVDLTYLRPWIVVPIFVVVFFGLMYVLGNLFAAGVGRVFWNWFEHGIGRLPIVRSVYSSTKQVTDYIFSDRELDFTRVVAVEYPARSIWSLAFVTSEGIADVQRAAGEPMLAIMVPTSPLPITGYTMLIPRSEVLDVNMSVEEAVEYLVRCGVVVPSQQLERKAESS
ncbi:MAG: DUF502 domain-containing protein [Pirellulales bacterium]|nr:DUF502 domain-containing protein [Pirellulales bacterium]